MSPISSTTNASVSLPMAKVGGTDSDGDKDGTAKAAPSTPAPAQPVVTKPTATMGNNVNTYA